MAGHDPNMQCTPGRQALVAPVAASDPLQLLPLVGVEQDLQALTHLMSFTEHFGWQYATARDLARMRTEVSLLMGPHVHARTVHGASRALTIASRFLSPDRGVLVRNSRIRFAICSGRSPICRCPVASKFAAGTVA